MYELASRIAIAIRWTVFCFGILLSLFTVVGLQEFFGLPSDAQPDSLFIAKAGVFASITAIAFFASMIPTGNATETSIARIVAGLMGIASAVGVSYYTLALVADGNPVEILETIGGLTLAVMFVLGLFVIEVVALAVFVLWLAFGVMVRTVQIRFGRVH